MAMEAMLHANNQASHTRGRGWGRWLRTAGIWLLIGVGSVAFSGYVVVHWIERQVLTSDNWVALVSPLPKQPVVSTALGTYLSDQVFEAVPIQEHIANALPPRAAFLAQPLTNQLHSYTTTAAQKLVASDGFQALWTGANRAAIERLLATARDQTSPVPSKVNEKFAITIDDASTQLRQVLGTASEAIPALQPATHRNLTVVADLHTRPRRLRQYVRALDVLAVVLPLFVAASLLSALAFSSHRRRTLMGITAMVFILALLELISVKWLRQEVLGQVQNSANLNAVAYVYDTVVGLLRHMILVVLVLMAVLFGVLILAGSAQWAIALRSYVHMERLRDSRALVRWRKVRVWTRQYELYIVSAIVVLVLLGVALFFPVTTWVVINALLLIISLLGVLHSMATPPDHRPLDIP